MSQVQEYLDRTRAKANEIRGALRAVVEAGEAAGYWKHTPEAQAPIFPVTDEREPNEHYTHTHVTTPAGLRFLARLERSYSTGQKPRVTFSTCALEAGTLKVDHDAADLRDDNGHRRNAQRITASADATRDPASVAKSMHNRVTNNPEAIAVQTAIHAALTEQLGMRARLRAAFDSLLQAYPDAHAVPYDQRAPRRFPDGAYYRTGIWVRGLGNCELSADGRLSIERGITLQSWEALPALLKLMGKEE